MQVSLNSEDLVSRWQRQIGSRRPYRHQRPLAALGFLRRPSDKQEALVELRHLLAVVLFDEDIGRTVPALRLAGYGASQVPHGVQLGGAECCKFYKDLRLAPERGGWSLQVDSTNVDLLHLALQQHAEIHRVDRFAPKSARLHPQLPRLWAGFALSDAESVEASGPEFADLCAKFKLTSQAMLQKFRREHQGLACFPLDWVGDQLSRSLSVFADMSETPRTQVFRLTEYPQSLQGFQGATAFDFYNSKQREKFAVRLERLQRKRERNLQLEPPGSSAQSPEEEGAAAMIPLAETCEDAC